MIPTRWKTLFEEQLGDAAQRVAGAEANLGTDEGAKALQGAYQAVVAAASVRVWLADHPWERPLPSDEMQRRVQAEFPGLFAALAALNIQEALTSAWSAESAAPYVAEAKAYLAETQMEFTAWLEGN